MSIIIDESLREVIDFLIQQSRFESSPDGERFHIINENDFETLIEIIKELNIEKNK